MASSLTYSLIDQLLISAHKGNAMKEALAYIVYMQDVALGTATTRGLINPSTLTRRTALTIPALLLNNPVVTIYRSLYFVYFHLLLLSVLIIYILGFKLNLNESEYK